MPNPPDIKLLENQIDLEGDTVIHGHLKVVDGLLSAKLQKLEGWEFLGSPPTIHLSAADVVLDHRPITESGRNVALSHTAGDKLIINRGNGYRGGVQIEGRVQAPGILDAGACSADTLRVGLRGVAPLPRKERYVTIDAETIVARNVPVFLGPFQRREDIDLVEVVIELRKRVAQLEARLAKLES